MWWMRSPLFGLCGLLLILIGPTAGARVAGVVAVLASWLSFLVERKVHRAINRKEEPPRRQPF